MRVTRRSRAMGRVARIRLGELSPLRPLGWLPRLTSDLDSGAWDINFGCLREEAHYVGSLRPLTNHLR